MLESPASRPRTMLHEPLRVFPCSLRIALGPRCAVQLREYGKRRHGVNRSGGRCCGDALVAVDPPGHLPHNPLLPGRLSVFRRRDNADPRVPIPPGDVHRPIGPQVIAPFRPAAMHHKPINPVRRFRPFRSVQYPSPLLRSGHKCRLRYSVGVKPYCLLKLSRK